MRGAWKNKGRQQVVVSRRGESAEMDTYVWEVDSEAGKMSVPFGCVIDERPRRFYCLPVLEAWRDGRQPERFLKQACRVGSRLLIEFEATLREAADKLPKEIREATFGGSPPSQDHYDFFLAIFRNRFAGHVKPGRGFRSARDFFKAKDFESRRQKRNPIESVIPGLNEEVDPDITRKKPAELIELAQKMALDRGVRSSRPEDDPILAHELPSRSPLDELLVDGLVPPLSRQSVCATYRSVSDALIQGSDFDAQAQHLTEHHDEWRHFFRRLLEKFIDLKRSEKRFDQWLKIEREHGFLRLLPGGSSGKKPDAEKARIRAKGYYRQLLWAAYQSASRCYGALMLLIWMDFTQSEIISPTEVESRLFRQVNAPQMYLAGLPLAFFLPTHLKWLINPLLERWNSEQFAPSAYAPLTFLLEAHGEASQVKRTDDRERKKRQRASQGGRRTSKQRPKGGDVLSEIACDSLGHGRPTEQVFAHEDDEPFLDDPLDFPLCEQGKCPNCEAQAKLSKMIIRKGDWIVAEIGCPACGFEDTVRIPGPPDA